MTIYRGVGGSGDSATGEDVFGDNSSITSLNGISGAIQTPTYIKFAPNANHTANQGELTWNTAEGTLDLGLNHGGVVLQIGQELHYRVTNQSGADIPDGTLVAFVGTTGNSGKLLIDVYDGTQASKAILGLTTETIINGANGYVTSFGKVRGIQTNGANYSETWVDGDILYPSPTGLTKILPQAPAAKQPIAVVVNAHGSNGELFVRVQSGTTLGEDELVQLASLTDGDVLQYDSTDGRFENRSLSSAGIQPTLVSGVNIKTINSESLLGSTNIAVTTAADIANMLETTDIGVSVQGYDANTAKYNDVTANFTGTLQNGGSNVVVDSDIGSSVLAYDSNLQGFINTFTLPTTDGSNGFVLSTNGAGTLSLTAPGGIPDGDKGDIVVSSGGTTWTIDTGVISTTKLGGDITTAGKNLLDDATVADQRTTLGLGSLATLNTVNTSQIDTSSVTNAKLAFDGGALSFRNKIIGGDFTTNPWQRGTSFTAPVSENYFADRWQFGYVTGGAVNILKTADAPTASQAGVFTQHCFHVDVTTADASIAANEYVLLRQPVEGFNAASFGFGQSGTRYVTLSFWHKHTKTGVYCIAFRNSAANRSYVAEYTQDVTDTWEKAVITIPVDTSGTWLYDNGIGFRLDFALAVGTDRQTTANTWTAGSFVATSNQVNVLDNVANNFKIALVQLEAGSTATPFETRSVGQELALCQRYFELIGYFTLGGYGVAGSVFRTTCRYQTSKRANPTVALGTLTENTNVTSVAFDTTTVDGARVLIVATATGEFFRSYTNSTASAEL